MDRGRSFTPGPGKTAPRLINDLLDYDPQHPRRNGWNILRDPAPQYKGIPILRKSPTDCRHSLVKKERQTSSPKSKDEQPGEATVYVVGAMCTNCRYHFQIKVDLRHRKSGQVPCNLSNEKYPLHHLRHTISWSDKQDEESKGPNKYDAPEEAHRFVCTAPDCPAIVDIKLYPQRLGTDRIACFMDPKQVFERGKKEIALNPSRYEGYENVHPLKPLQALSYLRAYVQDARSAAEEGTERKNIQKRNKKYRLAFGDDCDDIFEYLGFEHAESKAEPGEEINYFWVAPAVTAENKDFIDDILMEINMQMASKTASERQQSNIRGAVYVPLPVLRDIERSLGYWDYPKRSRTVDLSRDEHPFYASLGAIDDFPDDLLGWAYDRQRDCDPANRPYYLDCLEDLANGRDSPDLQMKVVMATSSGEYGLKAVYEAYKFFGLDPHTTEGDDHIIGLYKSRIESAPRQKVEARDCLHTIARARNSEKIQIIADDKTMTLEEAFELLGIPADTASDSIEAQAIAMALDTDKAQVARALRVIANSRTGDFALQRAASSMESGTAESTLDVGEAYTRLQITTRTASDDMVFNYYQSLSSGAGPGAKDSFTEALRVIAYDRQSNFLLRKLDDPNADVQAEASTADQPIGLDNIGNTCYLNSLLQYYYTIKPVRDVVMDFSLYRMELNEANLRKKRVGGRIVAKSEIIKAQKFLDELHNLFDNLKSASIRSIKPTKELAELTIFSSELVANYRRASITSPNGPPNLMSLEGPVYGPESPPPPVPSRPSPTPLEDDVVMIDDSDGKTLEPRDDSSEATLVDMEPLPVQNEISIKTSTTQAEVDQEEDAVMINGDSVSPILEKVHAAPDNPPPVPPRNKSGLVISTKNTKEVSSEDALWRFGSQQDVGEVIGNVTFRMQCAIKPTSIDEVTGEQIDSIRDTFYGDNAVYLEKAEKLERKVESYSTTMVYPSKTGPRDIYEALDVVFDEQKVEIDNTVIPQYTSISKLPPMLQILVQRTDYDTKLHKSFKNTNQVLFPETIYLDRYMDSKNPDSPLMRRRRETWKWKEQLRVLEARKEALQNQGEEINVADALLATKQFLSALQESEIEGVEVDPSLPEALDERITEVANELEEISAQICVLKQSLQEQFTDMREHEYKLHSVFIHRGESGAGHYWIYIYDFANDVWRKYNDEHVSVVKDRREIFEHQNGPAAGGGTPYYLAYVRSAEKEELIDPVHREVREQIEMADMSNTETGDWKATQQDEGVVMDDEGDSRHIEHAQPRPLRPKPATGDGPAADWREQWEQGPASHAGGDTAEKQW